MSNEVLVPLDETLLRLPSCLTLHAQLRPNLSKFTSQEYVQFINRQTNQLNICGIIRKTELETIVLALAVYRHYLTTFDTVRFEIDDIIVDEKERNRGLATRLFHYLTEQAKTCGASQNLVHCDLANTDVHRFFFRLGLTIHEFEFYVKNDQLSPLNNQISITDITELSEEENEQLLIRTHHIHRQLRPHLPSDREAYINQIRDICRAGPARMLVAINNDKKKEAVGLAVCRITCNTKYSKYIYCDDLVTDENNRSSGIGRCLVNFMKQQGKKLGINQLILDSGCHRGRAHRFYHREGFIINRFGFSMSF